MATILLQLNAANSSSSTWFDNSGNGYDLSLTNVGFDEYPIPVQIFSGVSSGTSTSHTVTFTGATSGVSIEAYFSLSSVNTNQGLFTFNGGGKYLNIEIENYNAIRFETQALQAIYSTYSAKTSEWIYLVCTSDGTTSKIYINGVLNSSGTKPLETSITGPFVVGRYSGFLNGQVNTLNLYKGVLTQSEISSNYAALSNQPIGVNQFYEYTADMLGSFSGGTLPAGTEVPYAQWATDNNDGTTKQVVQLNGIALGGQYGLNN
jgi:Concanavalin A-like lectin/glucanases superfamily